MAVKRDTRRLIDPGAWLLVRWLALIAAALTAGGSAGCGKGGGGGVTGPIAETENLAAIRKAYVAASDKLGHPPKNLDELKPSLPEGGDKLLVSPNDGLPYVIVYGGDPRKHVTAYEQKGVNGLRMAVDQTELPKRVDKEEFDLLSFPPGHKKTTK